MVPSPGMRERDGEKVKRSERNKEKRAEEKDKRGWGGVEG